MIFSPNRKRRNEGLGGSPGKPPKTFLQNVRSGGVSGPAFGWCHPSPIPHPDVTRKINKKNTRGLSADPCSVIDEELHVCAMSLSCLCHAYVMSMPCLCHVCVMSMSCLCLVYVTSMPCLWHVYGMSMPCLCRVYVLSMSMSLSYPCPTALHSFH